MTGQPPSFAAQLAAVAAAQRPQQSSGRINPRPAGKIIPGSVTDRVLRTLQACHPRWLHHNQLRAATAGSRGAIGWAVAYLVEQKLIRTASSHRNPTYLRYQATGKGGA